MKKIIVVAALILTAGALSSQTTVSNSKHTSVALPQLLSATAKKDIATAD